MPRNLALNISVGALLNKSVGKVFSRASKSSEALGKQQKSLNQQMRKLNAVRRYSDQLEKLKREASASGHVTESLARRIRLTEAQLSAASADARRMKLNINQLGEAEAQLNRQLEKNNRALQRRQKLDTRMQRLRTGARFARQKATKGAVIGGTALGAALTAITYTNRLTAEQANLARAVGISARDMAIWSTIVGQAGFDAETVNSLVEELNNKFGESKGLAEQTTPVKDAMKILRLDFERIKRLKPDEQFRSIVEAAQELGGQKAVSAADILLGGEANRIIGYLNSLGVPVNQLFQRMEKLQVLSEEGIQGARTFSVAWGELSATLGQAFKEVSGLIGHELAPQMRQWAENLSQWFRQNRNQIGQFSNDLGTTLKKLGAGLVDLAIHLPEIVTAMTTLSDLVLRWFGSDEKGQQRLQAHKKEQARRRTLRQQQDAEGKRLNQPYAPFSYAEAQRLIEARQPSQPATTRQIRQDNRVSFHITQQPGQSPEQLAGQIERRLRSVQDDRLTYDGFTQAEAIT